MNNKKVKLVKALSAILYIPCFVSQNTLAMKPNTTTMCETKSKDIYFYVEEDDAKNTRKALSICTLVKGKLENFKYSNVCFMKRCERDQWLKYVEKILKGEGAMVTYIGNIPQNIDPTTEGSAEFDKNIEDFFTPYFNYFYIKNDKFSFRILIAKVNEEYYAVKIVRNIVTEKDLGDFNKEDKIGSEKFYEVSHKPANITSEKKIALQKFPISIGTKPILAKFNPITIEEIKKTAYGTNVNKTTVVEKSKNNSGKIKITKKWKILTNKKIK